MPRPHRTARDRRWTPSGADWRRVLDQEPDPLDDPAEEFFLSEQQRRERWEALRAEALEVWIAEHPGTRPSLWWQYDAPEPRIRLGGTGDRLSEVLAYAAALAWGIPSEGWLSEARFDHYGELWNHEHDRSAEPIDSSDPPTFESQAVYLERLGLLTPAERGLFDAGELDVEPEEVDTGEG